MKENDSGILIESMPNINENKYFYCTEFIKINQPIEFGIKLLKKKEVIEYKIIYFSNNKVINYNNFGYLNETNFNIFIINYNFNQLIKNLNSPHFKLKKSYILPPYSFLKKDIATIDNHWYFFNIYNNYFCFCKGNSCLEIDLYQHCKYKFYLHIIDINRNLYKKSHYLFADFIVKDVEPIDGYPIFREMLKQNLSAHYMTIDENIYNNFCHNNNNFFQPFPIIYEKKINGDFLEKYFEIILKLKVVVGVDSYYSIDNIFYNIEYINYIFLGHGVSFFKKYLYNDYLSYKRFDKIVIPPSKIFINIAEQYGWKSKDIIKIGLPRWDNYNMEKKDFFSEKINKNKTIFMMFTWRKCINGKPLSKFYFNNIYDLLNNSELVEKLKDKKIIVYFSYHHSLKRKKIFTFKANSNVILVNQNKISEYLRESSLIITDFSSIVFDYIYQKKPFILYIPDSNEPKLESIYVQPYYDIINGLKNGTIYFENKIFDINKAVKKIIYYLDNDFKLDNKLNNFFNNFNFQGKNYTISLINYIKNL
jgi:CDP-glycerol glycerophosphotransferase (TagB/SpsB family)